MNDIDNIISNLEINIGWIEHNPYHQFPGYENTIIAMKEASELLKESKPRVIDFKEIENYEVLYLEVKDVDDELGFSPWIRTSDGLWYSPIFNGEPENGIKLVKEEQYNVIARCWNKRPTEAQRKAVEWIGEDDAGKTEEPVGES